jgi:hypothetical protein
MRDGRKPYPGSLEDRVAALEYKLANAVAYSDAVAVTWANPYVVNGARATEGEPNGLRRLLARHPVSPAARTEWLPASTNEWLGACRRSGESWSGRNLSARIT